MENELMEVYCGSYLFQVQNVSKEKEEEEGQKGKIKNYKYPFNFEFKKKEAFNKGEFRGSGIYLIRYDRTIIYIGKYMPYAKGNATNVG